MPGSLVAAAVRTSQVTGDEGVSRTFRLVRAAAAAFDIFNVVAQAAHDAAEESGMQAVAEFGQQGLDDLHGDLANIVADDQTVRAAHADPQYAPDITQQPDGRLDRDREIASAWRGCSRGNPELRRHCEERSDEAISSQLIMN